ncbi:hypothetical protein JOC34_000052 [Virgibacillus halotolerans]|nr:hypothetical protein [Virgibacillus halotolerans]
MIHADETGVRVEGKLQWLHSVSDENWTHYHIHPKRAKEAMDVGGFLPNYHSTVVHDFWKSYFNDDYNFKHVLCGVHLLRECQGIIDYDQHDWAQKLQVLLRDALEEKNKQRQLRMNQSKEVERQKVRQPT